MSDSQNMDGGDILAALLLPFAFVSFLLRLGGFLEWSWWFWLPLLLVLLPLLLVVIAVMLPFLLLDHHIGQPGGVLIYGLLAAAYVTGLCLTERHERRAVDAAANDSQPIANHNPPGHRHVM